MNRLFFKTMHGTITIARCFPALSDLRSNLFIRWFRVNAKLLSDSDNIDDELEKSLQRKKPPLGIANRHLKDPSKVYKFNAWDNVEWTDEQRLQAEKIIDGNSAIKFPESEERQLEEKQEDNWDQFYSIHQNKFFKDRHWLPVEFPELMSGSKDGHEKLKIFELGSGVGNTVFPILKYNDSDSLMIFASDFSQQAIDILKTCPQYDEKRCCAFRLDATADDWDVPFEENSIDLIFLIFVLSAIDPEKHEKVVIQIFKYLKPGGQVLFRDYGRGDMSQLRFKSGKCIKDNFYMRGDGTRCFFFTEEKLKELFSNYLQEQLIVDRRLQVNRGKMLKMYRIWIQCKFRKPFLT